jgi:hypothetical protein
MVKWMHARGVTSGHMYATAAAHVAAVTVMWVKAERAGDATRQRRALALSLCPPIYQLWGIALKLEETRAAV